MSKAVLFGINYIKTPSARLKGCVNDVNNMAHYLSNKEEYDIVKVYTDEKNEYKTRANAIINTVYKLAIDSHRYKLKRVWIHFSGHGCGIMDRNKDESDGRDECIVPSDFKRSGVITDDLIKRVLRYFNKNTIPNDNTIEYTTKGILLSFTVLINIIQRYKKSQSYYIL